MSVSGESVYNFPTICERIPDVHCPNGECTRYEQVKCHNGQCNNSTGLCECYPCWSGKSCENLENEFLPSFGETSLSVIIDKYNFDEVIIDVTATDKDAEKCDDTAENDCPCARILYAIESGNENSGFLIDPKTGGIQLSERFSRNKSDFPPPGTKQKLVISARNPVHRSRRRLESIPHSSTDEHGSIIDTVVVMVEFDDEPPAGDFGRYKGEKVDETRRLAENDTKYAAYESMVPHSRRKRSNSGTPSEETFFFEKVDTSANMTEVNIGEYVELQVTLWLPSGTTSDVIVEFFSQNDGNGAVFILYDPVIATVGGNFPSFDSNSVVTSYSASSNDGRYDQVLMDLGDITNNADDSADDVPNQITLQVKAILTANDATQYGDVYHVSASVTYGSSEDVWTADMEFTPVNDTHTWAVETPAVDIFGPLGQNMSVESSTIFTINITLANYATEDIVIDLIADNYTTDPTMTICDYEFAGKGQNYDCMSDEAYTYETTEINGTIWTVLATFDLGTWVNNGLRYGVTDTDSNTISTEAVVHLTDSTELLDYSTHWLGVAVSVGDDKIYSFQYGINPQPLSSPDMTSEPVIDFYPIDGNQVVIGGCVGFVITIDLQESTTSRVIVDLSLPMTASDEAQLRVCSAQVVSAGYNIPCARKVVPSYLEIDGVNQDFVRFDFGRISNVGRRSDSEDSELKLHVSAQLLFDAPDVSNGTELMVSAGVRYEMEGKDLMWMTNYPLIVVDQRLTDYGSAAKEPSFTLTNRANDDKLYSKSAVSFTIDIDIPAETTHTDLTVIIKPPKDDGDMRKPFMSVCRVEVLSVGDLFPCFDANRTVFTYESTSNTSDATDKATVELGVITNAFLTEIMDADSSLSATVTLLVYMHWEDHEYHADGQTLSTVVSATWGHSGSWSDTIDYVTELDEDPALTNSNEDPQFKFYLESGQSTYLKAGGTAVYTLVMYTPINSVATYAVDVESPNNTLSVCRAHMRLGGENIPCFDDTREAMYLSYEEDGHRDRAFLDIGPIRNTGVEPNTRQADNRVVGQIVVKLEDAALPPDNLTLPDPQSFGVSVQVGDTDSFTAADTITVDVEEVSTHLDTLPEFTFIKNNPAESRVTIGGVVEFNLDLYIPPESIAHYEINFQSDVERPYKTTICEARLISSGWNVPCVNGTFLETFYNSSTFDEHLDTAYIDAGVITNMRLESEGLPVKYDKNKVRVQLLTRLEGNETIVEGDTFWLGASVTINGYNEFIMQSGFNATEDNIQEETDFEPIFHVTRPRGNLSMTIGQKERYYLNISTPTMTTPMAINLSLPIAGDEAFLTITDITLEHVGRNFGCFQLWDEEFIPTTVSTKGSSQNDTALIDFGVITNHGTSHKYQYNGPGDEDDEIIVSFEIQLADHYQLVNQTLLDFSIKFLYSLDREVEFIETVEAIMMPGDYPIIDLNMTIEDYDLRSVHQGDVVHARLSLKHDEESTAHAHGVVVNLMIPYYIGVDPVVEIEGPSLCTETSDEGIKFHFSEMFFTDIFTLWFNFTIDDGRHMSIELDVINTTVPMEIVYYKTGGLDNDGYVILGDRYNTEMLLLDLTYTIEDCSDRMDYLINDCQFSASSTLNESHAAHQSRMNSPTGWAPGVRLTNPYQGNDYLQIEFPSMMRFSGIKIQQGPNGSHYVETFKISYSEEDIVWYDYTEDGSEVTFENDYSTFVPEVNVTEDPWVMHTFANPFNGRYIRVRPQTHKSGTNYPILRFELIGCLREETISNDVCLPPTKRDLGYFERGFLVEPLSNTVIVCILEYIDGPTRCSYSKDNGTTWEAIDNNVATVIGAHNETGELYGISQNKEAIMISTDFGESFFSVNDDYFFELFDEPGRVRSTIQLPWDDLADVPDAEYWEYSMMAMIEPLGNSTGRFLEYAGAGNGLYLREVYYDQMNSTATSWSLVGEWGYP
ncbi:uncharacterized protein [Diadema antillarum]|uniref:uncharacterized protein n=1 Tax=Diadema antillarum TaxID=105358 RepID=UPI003A8C4B8F